MAATRWVCCAELHTADHVHSTPLRCRNTAPEYTLPCQHQHDIHTYALATSVHKYRVIFSWKTILVTLSFIINVLLDSHTVHTAHFCCSPVDQSLPQSTVDFSSTQHHHTASAPISDSKLCHVSTNTSTANPIWPSSSVLYCLLAHYRLCDYALNKFMIDTNGDLLHQSYVQFYLYSL